MPACDAFVACEEDELRLSQHRLQGSVRGLWTPPRTILVVHPCFCARPVLPKPGLSFFLLAVDPRDLRPPPPQSRRPSAPRVTNPECEARAPQATRRSRFMS